MSHAATVLRGALHRLLGVQLLLTLAVAGAYLAMVGAASALAALYGGGIALVGSLIAGWRILRAGALAGQNPRVGEVEIYMGAAMRFIATLVLLAIGMGLLRLDPLAIIAAFAAAQIGYMFNRVDTSWTPPK
ncbi:ATP synthase subunit I [Ectothiorhodospiraceae bacterium 2226]|nr:ATP synthase subunit I [Ectothiorhodospiraceae bacterium 2226]